MKLNNVLNKAKQFKSNNLNKFLYSNNEIILNIFLDKKDLTAKLENNLISLEVIDNLAFEADTLSLKLHDDGIKLPKKGVTLNVTLGFKNDNTYFNGAFIVDELSLSGAPDVLEIKASSANLRTSMNIRRNCSFDNITLEQLVAQICMRHNLQYNINSALALEHIAHIDQTEESDVSFLIRLLEDFGACLALKDNKLLIFNQGAPLTINGKIIPPSIIKREDGLNFSFNVFDRGNYTGCKAFFLDYDKKINDGKNYIIVGTTENIKTLNHTYKNINNARRAATAKLIALQRAACSFSITLACARPDLIPGTTCRVNGFKRDIDFDNWQIVRVAHSVSKQNGFITTVELERKLI